jgi:hypothetical protein
MNRGSPALADSSMMSSCEGDAELSPVSPDKQARPAYSTAALHLQRASWPQLKELSKELSQEKARYVKSPCGLSMISWMARTGVARTFAVVLYSLMNPVNCDRFMLAQTHVLTRAI